MGTKVITLTSGSVWTVPTDWNSGNNTIERWGGGGSGSSGGLGNSGGGGGGGGYRINTNVPLTPGDNIAIQIGAGGAAPINTGAIPGSPGGDTLFGGLAIAYGASAPG